MLLADGGPATGFQGGGAPRTRALECTYDLGLLRLWLKRPC